jgi:hypothetical protein
VNLTPADACDAVLAKNGDLRGGRYVASPVDGTSLMLVVGQDDQENPFVGGGWLVGPDRQVWTVSSNSGIHEFGISARLVGALYDRGLAGRVDPDQLSHRIRTLTEAREALVRDVIAEAAAGQLGMPKPRQLP